jgi:hypothetical protein
LVSFAAEEKDVAASAWEAAAARSVEDECGDWKERI